MAKGKSAAPILLLLVAVAGLATVVWLKHRFTYLEPLPPIGTPSSAVDIDVYIDGSKSMQNFLKPHTADNPFKEFLEKCELALRSGVSRGSWDLDRRNVRIWKFGPPNGPVQLTGASALIDLAQDPSHFDADNTSIEDAFRHHQSSPATMSPMANGVGGPAPQQTGHVMIVITDLYESDGELQKPGLALADQFLGLPHGAVAVYGVRNPFEGRVSDVPGQARAKVVLKDAATSMPFYIIIAGDRAADVRNAQRVLTSGEYGQPLHKARTKGRLFAAYFSKSAGRYSQARVVYDPRVYRDDKDRLLHFSADPAAAPKPGEEGSAAPTLEPRKGNSMAPPRPRSLSYSAFVPRYEPDHRLGIAELEVIKRGLKENLVGVSWPRDPESDDAPIWHTRGAETASKTEWRAYAFDCPVAKGASTQECQKALHTGARALDGIHICNSPQGAAAYCRADSADQDAQPALAVVIDRKYLPPRKYLLEFDEVATAASDVDRFNAETPVMKEWNLTPREAHDVLTNLSFPAGDSKDDGKPGKTPNLAEFLTALNGRVMSSGSGAGDASVPLQTFFLYLNAR